MHQHTALDNNDVHSINMSINGDVAVDSNYRQIFHADKEHQNCRCFFKGAQFILKSLQQHLETIKICYWVLVRRTKAAC